MKFKLIACEVLTRELSIAAAESRNVVDPLFLPFGLHSSPDQLRSRIQSEIDSLEGSDYDFIALGYCLCSRGTADLIAKSIPIVIPRAHDCITMFLGSRQRYNEEFMANLGTYYYSPGWIERSNGEIEQGYVNEKNRVERFEEYVRKYGEDNARFLVEQEGLWLQNYSRATLIDMQIGDHKVYNAFVRCVASLHNWTYHELTGDWSLIRRLVNGDWDDDFLIVNPGEIVVESFDELVISCQPGGTTLHSDPEER
jgi:hypothetical protein